MSKMVKSTRFVRITPDTCRVCLRDMPVKTILKAFDQTSVELDEPYTLGYMYEVCTGYKAETGPQQICVVCEASLVKLFVFRCEVDNSENLLKNIEFPEEKDTGEIKEISIQEDNDHFEEGEEFQITSMESQEPTFEAGKVEEVQIQEIEYEPQHQEFIDDSMIEERLEYDEEPTEYQIIPSDENDPKRCNMCHKRFSSISHLEQHKKIHLGIKDFQCCECMKWFRTLSQLRVHMQSHYEARNYECEICHKKFKTRKTLKGHEETHSNAISFFCEFCDQGYTNKTALRVHKVRRHRDQKLTIKHEKVEVVQSI